MYNAHCTVPTSLYIGNQSTNHNVCQDGVLLECELCLERLPAGSVPMPRVAGGKARPTSLKEVGGVEAGRVAALLHVPGEGADQHQVWAALEAERSILVYAARLVEKNWLY